MALVSVLLAFSDVVVLGLLALAMGCNNVALKREGSIGPRSYVTGTLVSLGSSFANAISGRAPWLEMGPSLAMWSSLALGALMGGHLASQLSDVVAILVPAVVISSIGAIIAAGWVQLDEPPLRT